MNFKQHLKSILALLLSFIMVFGSIFGIGSIHAEAADGPTITAQPTATTVTEGEKAFFTVSAAGTGTLKYQWQVSTDGGSSWRNSTVTSAATNTLSFKASLSYSGRKYRCKVSDTNGNKVTSKAVLLTVNAPAPVISGQPVNQTVSAGATVSFNITAAGTGTLQYQWQVSTDQGSTWRNCTAAGYNTNTYTFKTSASHNGRKYRCKVSDTYGHTVKTNAASLTVTPAITISTQPKSQKITEGEKVTFTVKADGTGTLKYQWQVSTDQGSTWKNCTAKGYNTASFVFKTSMSHNGRKYRCVITDGNGAAKNSKEALLTVLEAPGFKRVEITNENWRTYFDAEWHNFAYGYSYVFSLKRKYSDDIFEHAFTDLFNDEVLVQYSDILTKYTQCLNSGADIFTDPEYINMGFYDVRFDYSLTYHDNNNWSLLQPVTPRSYSRSEWQKQPDIQSLFLGADDAYKDTMYKLLYTQHLHITMYPGLHFADIPACDQYEALVRKYPDRDFTLITCRNPWDWLNDRYCKTFYSDGYHWDFYYYLRNNVAVSHNGGSTWKPAYPKGGYSLNFYPRYVTSDEAELPTVNISASGFIYIWE